MKIAMPRSFAGHCVIFALTTACSPAEGISETGKTYDGVGPDETIWLIGTEPFWGLTVSGNDATFSTPDNADGTQFEVNRFAGNNGLGITGTLDAVPFTATLTPGTCSDGMTDRAYPFTATVVLRGGTRQGCGYTSGQPFKGEAAP